MLSDYNADIHATMCCRNPANQACSSSMVSQPIELSIELIVHYTPQN